MNKPCKSDSGVNTSVVSDPTSGTGTPGWVTIFGLVSFIVFLLFTIFLFASGNNHGPGRHLPTSSASDHAPADVIDHGTKNSYTLSYT